MYLVLHISGRLDIPAVVRELKLLLRTRIELRRVNDRVLQSFVDGIEDVVHTHFPVLSAMMPGQVSADITLAVATVLRNNDGSGRKIGKQLCACIPHVGGNGQQEIGRNEMLEGY